LEMAIVIKDQTRCAICGEVIKSSDEFTAFPPAFPNQADPLHIFHDAAVHDRCLDTHPFREAAVRRIDERRVNSGSGKRICRICGKEVQDPNDYVGLGHLTDDPGSPLKDYNYAHFHRSHFGKWSRGPYVLSLLAAMAETGGWTGDALPALIDDLRSIIKNP